MKAILRQKLAVVKLIFKMGKRHPTSDLTLHLRNFGKRNKLNSKATRGEK